MKYHTHWIYLWGQSRFILSYTNYSNSPSHWPRPCVHNTLLPAWFLANIHKILIKLQTPGVSMFKISCCDLKLPSPLRICHPVSANDAGGWERDKTLTADFYSIQTTCEHRWLFIGLGRAVGTLPKIDSRKWNLNVETCMVYYDNFVCRLSICRSIQSRQNPSDEKVIALCEFGLLGCLTLNTPLWWTAREMKLKCF